MNDVQLLKKAFEDELAAAEDPETVAQIMRDQAAYEESGAHPLAPGSPLRVWNARHNLDTYRASFEAGQRISFLSAIDECAKNGLVIPDWAAAEFTKCFERMYSYEARTMGEAFDIEVAPNSKQPANQRMVSEECETAYTIVVCLRREGKAIDDNLFDEAAEALGMPRSRVKKYYYHFAKWGMPISKRVAEIIAAQYLLNLENSGNLPK